MWTKGLLPLTVTPEMVEAVDGAGDGHFIVGDPQEIWARLLAAAPQNTTVADALQRAVSLLEGLARDVPACEWLDDGWRKGADGHTELGRLRAALTLAKE